MHHRRCEVWVGAYSIILFSWWLNIWWLVRQIDPWEDTKDAVFCVERHLTHFGDLPHLNQEADETADDDDSVSLTVQDVEQYNQGLEDIEENRSHRKSCQRLAGPPKLNVCNKKEI